ncbi:Na(+)-translocating NADH-quinone reductase subunit F [Blautia hydrogenotrophica]|uniref:corrinoid activation/regeneration protein AcsV n=1 Tax=Blautia hydrogenotrophica TaxID=53443 RepID=UPI0006C334E8|nr:corrinoid activation/regeneration protein AcsV [Blautia hydrogenotrophica]CUN01845.1 Na(+)-translocating NADH-quinone reductase subunit F [Blautia hydrogenotrophica]SCH81452.1 Na(+)-translocating NADH-quinone reductase subunit F [uncultured Blautia sp.]
MYKVTFAFEDGNVVETFANTGDNLLEIAREANVAIDAPCSGNASCGKCRVQLKSGELDSKKTLHISEEEYQEGWRLACVSTVCADVTVLVPDIASAYKSRMKVADLSSKGEIAIFENVKSDIELAGIELTNSLDVVDVKMSPPSLDDTMPDNERLMRALRKYLNISRVRIPYSVLRKLPNVLRDNDFAVKCVVRTTPDDMFVYDIFGKDEDVLIGGLAIDIGTTTVSALIINMENGEILAKASAGNGQIRYGADVINRIIEQQKPGGTNRLQRAVIDDTINPMIQEMCKKASISRNSIYRMCVAANSTMNHLFAGINADPLRMEPYIPAFFKTNSLFASDVGIAINPDAHIIVAPNIGSYVGGDITAGTLVSMIWNKPEFSLFIDLGTNGELVFGNSDFMMSCACSAGPAFEGGDISCGMRATDGAIEACTIDKETMEPTYKIVGEPGTKPIGLCGSGIIDIISELYMCGIIDPKGKFIREGKRIRHDQYGMGSYVIAFEEEAGSVKDVEITEVDIDNFIRAKGAIFSAIRTMLGSLDFDVSMIDHVYVAGGIGSGINMENAVNIGMFPDVPLDKFHYIGNSSLSGAYVMLLSTKAEKKTYELASNMTYMELSTVPTYMDEFVGSCFIPHTDTGLFPNVKQR